MKGEPRKTHLQKLRYVIRRAAPDQPYRWWPVYGQRVRVPGWAHLEFFAYRDGPVVFVAEEKSGLHVAVSPTLPKAAECVLYALKDMSHADLKAALDAGLRAIGAGPKPVYEESRTNGPDQPREESNVVGA